MERVKELEKQIDEQQAELKRLKNVSKVNKKELDSFKKFVDKIEENKYIKYYHFIYDGRNGFDCDGWEEVIIWFGKKINELEKAKQFVCHIDPKMTKYFDEAIKFCKEDEEEDEDL
jgi:hypothetical protein